MIIQRYIFRELTQKLLWIMGLLILILAGNRFAGFLADAAEGSLPGDLVFTLLAYKMLASLPKILPISILAAMLLTFARMGGDRELVILSAAGVGRLFQIRIIMRFTLFFCLFASGITLYLAPWAERSMNQLKQEARQRADIAGIKPGQFKEFSRGDRVVYVQNPALDKISMEQIFVQVREQGKLGILTAASARFKVDETSGHKYIVFRDGRRYVGEPGLLDYQITEYETLCAVDRNCRGRACGGQDGRRAHAGIDRRRQPDLSGRTAMAPVSAGGVSVVATAGVFIAATAAGRAPLFALYHGYIDLPDLQQPARHRPNAAGARDSAGLYRPVVGRIFY